MPTWIIYAQIAIEIMKILKDKDKGEGLTELDLDTAINCLPIKDSTTEAIMELTPNIKQLLEDIGGLLK